jgi:hypothetical protein
MSKISIEVVQHLRTIEAYNGIYDAIKEAIGEVFEQNILPDARALSPVGLGVEKPPSKHNRESLEIKVYGTKHGPGARINSTSGHGGFLEVGTRNMGAQPYIWPAFQSNIGLLTTRIRENISEVKVDNQQAADLGRVLPDEE